MYKFILILLGLYLDGFVYMMQTGATVKDMKPRVRCLYALIYTLVASGMAMIGYGCAYLFKTSMDGRSEMLVASVIIIVLGTRMLWQGLLGRNTYVERLDKNFSKMKFFRTAVITNLDTMALGAGFSFMGSGALTALMLFLIFGFIIVYAALTIGYNLGASYQREVSIAGGVLMVIFAIWILVVYVL
jgi:putative Mn2+ efflux pump MntP